MDSKLIDKYYKGECSPQEVEQVLEWFKRKEMDAGQLQDMYEFWQEAEEEKTNEEFSQASARLFTNISQKIDAQEKQSLTQHSVPVAAKKRKPAYIKNNQWKVLMKVAASIVLPIGLVWLLAVYFSGTTQPETQLVSVETSPGTRKTIHLADGSTIMLNGGSKVSYQPHFSASKREIRLKGEAFFEVAKDSLRPFIVQTGTLSTQALGTSFNISYREKENAISVALATGIVKIDKGTQQASSQIARLKPGQQLIYNKVNHGYKVKDFDAREVLSWREGILYFKQANLAQVVSKLENWYGLTVELTGKIPGRDKEWHYTGSYQNQSLDNVLEGIAFVKKFSYEKNGNTVKIKFN
ncbi:DUF4974 domain-containing protein [Rhodocytophaga rosea]|uniref:DUF4974 domain-containing protein n=1 Tax=Rhodocytophaga rosea TaxID=2704465 RepID=A0A6C0GCL2_9BACT|nr:FecR family protein [Rhodocytophaga rosea]QHT65696.1 DUF4974 domain-containing protein [Rhodocytophaga rosea]